MFEKRELEPKQNDFWVMAGELPKATPDAF